MKKIIHLTVMIIITSIWCSSFINDMFEVINIINEKEKSFGGIVRERIQATNNSYYLVIDFFNKETRKIDVSLIDYGMHNVNDTIYVNMYPSIFYQSYNNLEYSPIFTIFKLCLVHFLIFAILVIAFPYHYIYILNSKDITIIVMILTLINSISCIFILTDSIYSNINILRPFYSYIFTYYIVSGIFILSLLYKKYTIENKQ